MKQRISDFVGLRPHPTVVRLEDLDSPDAAWITAAFLATPSIRDHLSALARVFERDSGLGIFLIGQYGSGKSHFLAYLAQNLGTLIKTTPVVTPLSLLNYPATTGLEAIVTEAVGVEAGSGDRRRAWRQIEERYPSGLLLLLDELSEFLRSKPDRRAFNEDIRFLQFLGEWCADRRLWIVASLQEQIEHTGELEHSLYRKIKDRFPLRLLLTPAHVQDLVSESILQKKPGYDDAVATLIRDLRRSLPELPLDCDALSRLYPVHPASLELLEEVRDRFSQARGVVDFIVGQLGGRPEQEIAPFLDSPWGSLLTPDRIIDHFRDLFEIQPEFLPLAQRVFPYYRGALETIFPKPAQRQLAERLLHLLVLVHLSPAREELSTPEAVHWLLYKVSRLDPDRNLQVVGRVLEKLAREGRYVTARGGCFRLDVEDDGGALLERLLEREKEELQGQGEVVFEELAELLGGQGFDPFTLPREGWQNRHARWHFHERPYAVYMGHDDPPLLDGSAIQTTLVLRLPWGERGHAAGCYTVIPQRLRLGEELLELAALGRLRDRTWSPDVARRLEARFSERRSLFRSQVEQAYLGSSLQAPDDGRTLTPPRFETPLNLGTFLDRLAEAALRRLYPSFERFAPSHGPLARESYRRFLRAVLHQDLGPAGADEAVRMICEAYLVPMELAQRQARTYALVARLDRNELVRSVLPLIEHEPSPQKLVRHLESPIYGLVPDQIRLLLIVLLVAGEIDIVQGKRSLRDTYETLPDPLKYDRVVAGTRLLAQELRAVEELRKGLDQPAIKQWTGAMQRRAAGELRQAGRESCGQLNALRRRVAELGDGSEPLAEEIDRLLAAWEPLLASDDDFDALRRFLATIGTPARFLEHLRSLDGLSQRLEELGRERKRFRHLLRHPAFSEAAEASVAVRREALGEAPALGDPQALEEWLERARQFYHEHKETYREAHDGFWKRLSEHAAWGFKAPPMARCRHLAMSPRLEELEACQRRLLELRCEGLIDLDFQPVCRCGFDGSIAPVVEELRCHDHLRSEVEAGMQAFFRRPEIRSSLESWIAEGFDEGGFVQAYLTGDKPYPEVTRLDLFERHLAGVELVREVSAGPLLELLQDRIWEIPSLVEAIAAHLGRHGESRLRFVAATEPDLEALILWCYEQALRHGLGLPAGLGRLADRDLAERLIPEWVGPSCLAHLEDLGLGEEAIDRILVWILGGQVKIPRGVVLSPLVQSACDIDAPDPVNNLDELAHAVRRLYAHHGWFHRIAGEAWLERLESLAASPHLDEPSPLVGLLRENPEQQWLVIDGLGLPLVPAVTADLEALLPEWELERRDLATVPAPTTTDGWYRQLVKAGLNHAFQKLEGVDELLHQTLLPLEDLERLALAQLHATLKDVRRRLNPAQPLLVFADHGFRLSPDGGSYTHGGTSLLERLVPVFFLRPVLAATGLDRR